VAKTTTASKQPALTRGKAMIIAVLTIVLVGVLYFQYGRSMGGAEVAEIDNSATPKRVPRPVSPTNPNSAEVAADAERDTQAALLEFDQSKWEPPELSTLVSYDPFALPDAFPRPPKIGGLNVAADGDAAEDHTRQLAEALADLRMQLDELKQRGVHVIVGQKDQYVAMIGDRLIHVGDEINGFTVTEIDPKEGVRVERKTAE
jgi:hypothetical protein